MADSETRHIDASKLSLNDATDFAWAEISCRHSSHGTDPHNNILRIYKDPASKHDDTAEAFSETIRSIRFLTGECTGGCGTHFALDNPVFTHRKEMEDQLADDIVSARTDDGIVGAVESQVPYAEWREFFEPTGICWGAPGNDPGEEIAADKSKYAGLMTWGGSAPTVTDGGLTGSKAFVVFTGSVNGENVVINRVRANAGLDSLTRQDSIRSFRRAHSPELTRGTRVSVTTRIPAAVAEVNTPAAEASSSAPSGTGPQSVPHRDTLEFSARLGAGTASGSQTFTGASDGHEVPSWTSQDLPTRVVPTGSSNTVSRSQSRQSLRALSRRSSEVFGQAVYGGVSLWRLTRQKASKKVQGIGRRLSESWSSLTGGEDRTSGAASPARTDEPGIAEIDGRPVLQTEPAELAPPSPSELHVGPI